MLVSEGFLTAHVGLQSVLISYRGHSPVLATVDIQGIKVLNSSCLSDLLLLLLLLLLYIYHLYIISIYYYKYTDLKQQFT